MSSTVGVSAPENPYLRGGGVSLVEREDDKHRYLVLGYEGGLEVPSWMASDGTLRLLALTLPAYLTGFEGTFLVEPDQVLCFAKDEQGATDIVAGSRHPALAEWHGEPNLNVLFAAGVLS